jgi:hypothetical protein
MTAENQIFRLKYLFCRPFHSPPPPHRLTVRVICSVSNVVIMQFVYCLEVDRGYWTVFCALCSSWTYLTSRKVACNAELRTARSLPDHQNALLHTVSCSAVGSTGPILRDVIASLALCSVTMWQYICIQSRPISERALLCLRFPTFARSSFL